MTQTTLATKATEQTAIYGHVRTICRHHEEKVDKTLQTKRSEQVDALVFDLQAARKEHFGTFTMFITENHKTHMSPLKGQLFHC